MVHVRAQAHRRRRALLSSLAHVRHGSASPATQATAREYVAVRAHLHTVRSRLIRDSRTLQCRMRAHGVASHRVLLQMQRACARETRELRRSVSANEGAANRLASRYEVLYHDLATAAGFESDA